MIPEQGELFLKLWGTSCAALGAGTFRNGVKGTQLLWDSTPPLFQGYWGSFCWSQAVIPSVLACCLLQIQPRGAPASLQRALQLFMAHLFGRLHTFRTKA